MYYDMTTMQTVIFHLNNIFLLCLFAAAINFWMKILLLTIHTTIIAIIVACEEIVCLTTLLYLSNIE